MQKNLLLIFLLSNIIQFGQSFLIGKVIKKDDLTPIQGVKIINQKSNLFCFSDEKGYFKIKANENDTIQFESTFYQSLNVIVTENIVEKIDNTFILEQKVFDLDEVSLTNFKARDFNANLNMEIKNDIKNKPYLYHPKSNYNIDILAVAGTIVKTLKKKKEFDESVILSYEFFEILFENNSFFNDIFIVKQLGVTIEEKSLFFQFCSYQQIKVSKQILIDNFQIMDILIKLSENYKKIKSEK